MWLHRRDSAMPYQTWRAFEPADLVEVANAYGEARTGRAGDLWWGYERDNLEGVIVKARRVER